MIPLKNVFHAEIKYNSTDKIKIIKSFQIENPDDFKYVFSENLLKPMNAFI